MRNLSTNQQGENSIENPSYLSLIDKAKTVNHYCDQSYGEDVNVSESNLLYSLVEYIMPQGLSQLISLPHLSSAAGDQRISRDMIK